MSAIFFLEHDIENMFFFLKKGKKKNKDFF